MFTHTKLSRSIIKVLVATLFSCTLIGCIHEAKINHASTTSSEAKNSHNLDIWPKLNIQVKTNVELEKKITKLLEVMTLEQKIAQMIQPEIRHITVEDMRKYGFGSYLNGGGAFPDNNKHATAKDWIKLAENMYQASVDDSIDGSAIPTMWGTDAVHGHNNVIGATLFPHNIGLGAANNPDLIEKIAAITAKEVMVTGIDWVFAPTVAVVRDDRWGRTYEGYSEDPEIVRHYAASIVKGLQGQMGKDFLGEERVISTIKHFLGDGGTEGGDDQGNTLASEQDLFTIHGQGYVGGLSAGAQSVMASFNSWHGEKIHGHNYLLTQVLKNKMGFDGFVVGDWNGHGQVKSCSNDSCPQAINAGLDIFMVATDAWKSLYENTIIQVENGEISLNRIDDAVSRILRVKLRAGLFDKPSPAKRLLSGKIEYIGSAEHRLVARQAVRESLVLLKNRNNILPLSLHQNILLTGDGADNIGKQSGGWSVTWQGTGNENKDFPGGTSIYQAIKAQLANGDGSLHYSVNGSFETKPDVAIVVFGEEPYAEGNGDLDNLEFQRGSKKDLALLNRLKAQGIAVVSVFISGRPLWVNPELNASDAFVAVWLPGSEGTGIADVLLRKVNNEINYDFAGKLSFSWPATPRQTSINRYDEDYQPLLPYGFGLTYADSNVLSDDLNETTGKENTELASKKIFEGGAISPWHLFVSTKGGRQEMTSSIVANEVVHIRSIDKLIQEDARQITWNGTGEGKVELSSQFSEDLRAYFENNSALLLEIKRDSSISAPVLLAMNCTEQCESSIDISTMLKELPQGEWKRISIDLACFINKGLDPGKIITPFMLSTTGELALSLAHVSIQPGLAVSAYLVCH